MDWIDQAFVLAARVHGEAGAVVELLTEEHGRINAFVSGGASRRMKAILQPGVKVEARYRARTHEHLGQVSLEAEGEGPGAFFDEPDALAGLAAAAAVAAGALPERQRHDGVYHGFSALSQALSFPEIWPAIYIRFEIGLLAELGFGLDLGVCAVTGGEDDLAYVSPKSGRAVGREAGAPYADKLMRLPAFLGPAPRPPDDQDLRDGFTLSGFFLEKFVFFPLNRPLPPPRFWLMERLQASGRL